MSPRKLSLTSLSVALCAAATLIIRVPVPATQGYINLGDSAIFVTALLFGPAMGAVTGGAGSALADLLGGYAHWAPFTLAIKGLEGWLVGLLFLRGRLTGWGVSRATVAAAAGGAWMALGYFITESYVYGSAPAMAALPGNIIQALGSLLVALPLSIALSRAGLRGGNDVDGQAGSGTE